MWVKHSHIGADISHSTVLPFTPLFLFLLLLSTVWFVPCSLALVNVIQREISAMVLHRLCHFVRFFFAYLCIQTSTSGETLTFPSDHEVRFHCTSRKIWSASLHGASR
ncbi:uncharacterized protein [Physcomitrium patens]|uniref:uncharacterized protein isoform X1 n=1 Tax=Physcomitrium patens TaxID=3218 RepID=UPI003CCD9DD8